MDKGVVGKKTAKVPWKRIGLRNVGFSVVCQYFNWQLFKTSTFAYTLPSHTKAPCQGNLHKIFLCHYLFKGAHDYSSDIILVGGCRGLGVAHWTWSWGIDTAFLISPGCPRHNSAFIVQKRGLKPPFDLIWFHFLVWLILWTIGWECTWFSTPCILPAMVFSSFSVAFHWTSMLTVFNFFWHNISCLRQRVYREMTESQFVVTATTSGASAV